MSQMSDDPTSDDQRRPLSRREARERAAAEAARAEQESSPADENVSLEESSSLEQSAPVSEPAPAEESDAESEPETRRARSEASSADQGPTMPAGSSLEALLHRDEEPVVQKKRRGKGCLIALIIAVVVLGGATAVGFWAWNVYGDRVQEALGLDGPHDYEEGEATGEALVTVESGDTGESLSPKLYEAGVTLEADSFTRYLRENDPNLPLSPGVYKLQLKMTSAAVVEALDDPDSRQENSVQLPEGLTVEASIARISESMGLSEEDLVAATEAPSAYGVDEDSLEGWLFPATYTFDPGATAEDVVSRLVARTRESLDKAGVPDDEVHDVLTIASIIQREARYEDDFYKVSRVIHNRLDSDTWGDTGGLLQMDSTVQYGYGETHAGTASSSKAALEDDNAWNTYKHKGLPAGPISNPGDLAIDAAMNPADGPWLYFVTVNLNTGETAFSETYAEHEKNVATWREWCSDNPDAGC